MVLVSVQEHICACVCVCVCVRVYVCRSVVETSTQETKYHTWRVGELRFIMPAGPEELTL